ncbi:MAG TPA: hypothetical protein VGO56_03145 [Pyrinomonadaceae bacterium]|jgi:hypothetical protein|nr:hypothetical protein [Pyrinomonadaceae bacterium]
MLRPDQKKLPLQRKLVAVLSVLLILLQGAASSRTIQTQSKWGEIKQGVGVGQILIGESTAADVEARHGSKYELKNRNDYSYRMEYADPEAAFYYCFKDPKKKIFLIEVHDGVAGGGIVIGKSTMKDVVAFYGEKVAGAEGIFEYPGIQFYFETPNEKEAGDGMNRKVIEVDIVARDQSSNFCD